MNTHPTYSLISEQLSKYPRSAGSLFQTYNDLKYSQQWSELELFELPSCARYAVRGIRPAAQDAPASYVVPCALAESISFSWLTQSFKELSNPGEIYVGITCEDASIVYYKLSRGVVKPSM